jgi:hypothetical protein
MLSLPQWLEALSSTLILTLSILPFIVVELSFLRTSSVDELGQS